MRPIEVDDTVWLVARTPAAPAICYTTPAPKCKVIEVSMPYLLVRLAGSRRKSDQHRVHVDNVRRSNPDAPRGVIHVVPKRGLDGEVTLW